MKRETDLKPFIFLLLAAFMCTADVLSQAPFRPPLPIDSTLINDPQKVVVLEQSLAWAFDSTYTQATIDTAEILLVQKLLKQKRKQAGYADYKWDEYKIQLIVALNSKKEKIVFVNGFLETLGADAAGWKKYLVIFYDGGQCFFDARINLTRRKVLSFKYHGHA